MGAAKSGRNLDKFQVAIKPLIATAPDQQRLSAGIHDAHARVAFYASTPAYSACFEAHGLGALAREMQVLSKAQRWEEMPALIADDILERYATVGTFDEIIPKLRTRYGDLVTHVEFSVPVTDPTSRENLAQMVRDQQAD